MVDRGGDLHRARPLLTKGVHHRLNELVYGLEALCLFEPFH